MAKLVVGKFSEAAFSAKMSVPAALWASGRATGKSNAAREINRQLDDLRASAISIYDELSATRENVTAEEIRNLLLGTAFGQETLLGYFRTFIEHFEKRVGVNREREQHNLTAMLVTVWLLSSRRNTSCRMFLSRP